MVWPNHKPKLFRRDVDAQALAPALAEQKVRVETETSSTEQIQVERLAAAKDFIDARTGQASAHFDQSDINARQIHDHLLVTWRGGRKYAAAWYSWTHTNVRMARAKMLEVEHEALHADEELRKAQSDRMDVASFFQLLDPSWWEHSAKLWRAAKEQKVAWREYYSAQKDFKSVYAAGSEFALKTLPQIGPGIKFTFENTIIFNTNGTAPKDLPGQIFNIVSGLVPNIPVNHFIRVQRNTLPSALVMSPPSIVQDARNAAPEAYPTDSAVAGAVLDEIFPTKVRKHAGKLASISNLLARAAKWLLRVLLAVIVVLVLILLLLLEKISDNNKRITECEQERQQLIAMLIEIEQKLPAANNSDNSSRKPEQITRIIEEQIISLETEINALRAENARLRSQVPGDLLNSRSQSQQGASQVAGLDAAPCWEIAAATGRTSRRVPYLYTIELREDDDTPFRVTKAFSAYAKDKIIPPSPFAGEQIDDNYQRSIYSSTEDAHAPYDQWISTGTFQSGILGRVSSLSTAHQCRHFVRLCDENYNHKDASSYKTLRTLIEGTFYIYRPTTACRQQPAG